MSTGGSASSMIADSSRAGSRDDTGCGEAPSFHEARHASCKRREVTEQTALVAREERELRRRHARTVVAHQARAARHVGAVEDRAELVYTGSRPDVALFGLEVE